MLLLHLMINGCANARDRWGDDDNHDHDAVTATTPDPRSATPAPSTSISSLPTAPTSGMLVDRALQRFVSERVSLRAAPKASALHTHNWDRVLDAIDQAVQQPPAARDLGAFVRARITLEVELDTDVRRGVLLPADLSRRMQRTLVGVDDSVSALRAANAPGTFAPAPRLEDGDFVLRAPLSPMVVSSPFGIRTDPLNNARRFHAGVDFDAPTGANVFASQSGLVVFAGLQGGYGRHVVIDHGEGVRTHYSHMSKIAVKVGMIVEEGQTVGFVGTTGRSLSLIHI